MSRLHAHTRSHTYSVLARIHTQEKFQVFESRGRVLLWVQYFVRRFPHVRLRLFAEHFPARMLTANIILIDPMGRRPAITARVHRTGTIRTGV